MGCCGPSTCFTCNDYPSKPDACMCGCGYLNGTWSIFTAQFFTFVGAVLSLATLGDCSFAEINKRITIDLSSRYDTATSFTKDVRGVGFITFETIDGHCYWYGESPGINGGNQLDNYWNVLGYEWQVGMALTWFSAIFAWYYFLYTISFCCSSQVRCCRYLNGFCLSVVLVVTQSCSFLAYNSSFCDEYDCSFSRTAGYSIGAILCYLVSGIAFFLSSDYPGDDHYNSMIQKNNMMRDNDNAVVYHPDPDLTSQEYDEAQRISQRLGGVGVGVGGSNYDNHNNNEETITEVVQATPVVNNNSSNKSSNNNIDDTGVVAVAESAPPPQPHDDEPVDLERNHRSNNNVDNYDRGINESSDDNRPTAAAQVY